MKTAKTLCLMASLILASSQILASPVLTQVLQSSFSPSALHETFSEPIDYSNATNHPYEDKSGSMVVIGNNNSYIFSNTGVTFASPIPNLYGNWLPIISAVKANQDFSFAYYGELMPNSGLIPGGAGAKFLLEAGSSSNHFAPFRLTFPGNGATRIGFNPIMSGQTPGTDRIVITAYGVTNNLLGILYAPVCNVTAWAGNFFGLAMSDGTAIQSIGIDYSTNNNAGNPGIANLMFDPYISTTKIWACGGSTGSWNQTENWTHGKPQNPGEIAIFSSATNSPATVTLDASQKAGQLVFDNSGAGYTIASGTSGNLTLDNGTNNAQIAVKNGNHQIDAPLALNSNLLIDSSPNTSLIIAGSINGLDKYLEKKGTGLLILQGSNAYSGGTTANAGTLQIKGVNTLAFGSSLSAGANATILLTANFAIPSLPSGGSTPKTASVPEPGTLVLLVCAGFFGGGIILRKRFHR